MAPIKLKFLNSYNSIILFLVSFLGFSSACKKENAVMLYGVPSMNFNIIGKIESTVDNDPIPDIIVEARNTRLVGTGFSKPDGNYKVEIGGWSGDQTFHIKFSDMDGALNGEFESLDTTIVFKDPVFTGGDGSWYIGVAEQELNVKLKPKK